MADSKSDVFTAQLRYTALSRWDNEGGAVSQCSQELLTSGEEHADVPEFTHTELVRLRMRVIALENLVIALLAEASDRQRDLAREMATYISPRAGFTPHPLTIHAANQMIHLVERAAQFRERPPAAMPYRRTTVFDENTLPAGFAGNIAPSPACGASSECWMAVCAIKCSTPSPRRSLRPAILASCGLSNRISSSRSAPCACRSSSTIFCPTCSVCCPVLFRETRRFLGRPEYAQWIVFQDSSTIRTLCSHVR